MDTPQSLSFQATQPGSKPSSSVGPPLSASQAGRLYRTFTAMEKVRLIEKFSGDLRRLKDEQVRLLMVAYCYKADPDYGTRVAQAVPVDLQRIRQIASNLSE